MLSRPGGLFKYTISETAYPRLVLDRVVNWKAYILSKALKLIFVSIFWENIHAIYYISVVSTFMNYLSLVPLCAPKLVQYSDVSPSTPIHCNLRSWVVNN